MNKQLLSEYIPNGDVFSLAGKSNAKKRQIVMQELTGKKQPIAKCGITAIKDLLYAISGVTGNCEARKQGNLKAWIKHG